MKEQLQKDAESVLTVGRGEVVTGRGPTHEDGAYLFWEFATDSYDLGFGVYFEWSDVKTNQVTHPFVDLDQSEISFIILSHIIMYRTI